MASTELHDQLWDNAKYLKDGLENSDSILVNQKHQLHQLLLVMKKTQEFSKRLKDEGVYVKSIVFPTVPRGTGRVRNMPTAAHTKEMLDKAIAAYEKVGKELGTIK